jgi:hypothetical protein
LFILLIPFGFLCILADTKRNDDIELINSMSLTHVTKGEKARC